MILAKLVADGVSLRAKQLRAIPKGIVGATVELEFESAEWQHLRKNVVFQGCVTRVVLDAGTSVEVPAEVVARPGWRLAVGVYGTDGENSVVIPTRWCDLGPVSDGADPSGDQSTNPCLPVWAQLQARIGDLKELSTRSKESLVAAVNELCAGSTGGMVTDPADLAAAVESCLQACIDPGTLSLEGGTLRVRTAGEAAAEDTRPITADAVYSACSAAVRADPQTLTEEQKAQARENIGAAPGRKCSFAAEGGASGAIYNVRVVGTRKGIFITDIRNNLVFTGCVLYYGDPKKTYAENMNMSCVRITFDALSGHITKQVDGFTISFDYDISGIPEGTKLTAKLDDTTLVATDCYYPAELPYTSLAMFEKIGIVGDSFASGEIYVDNGDGTYTGKDYYNLSWGQIMGRRNGVSVTNFSRGGLDTRDWLTSDKGLPLLQSTQAQDLYILALGINDIGMGADYLGTAADMTEDHANNPDTFYGNYGRIIEEIKAHAPKAKLIISTTARSTANHASFNTAIKTIAAHYGIPCVEQWRDDFFQSSFYLNNQVNYHPTAAVYAGMALALERLLVGCIVSNIDYFKDYVL